MALLFKVNKKKWDSLVELRGWRHPITDLSKRSGFGKSYCSQVINGGLAVSHDFMAKFIEIAGANPNHHEEWSALFEVVPDYSENVRKPFQKDNYAKMWGQKPYVQGVAGLSESGRIRVKDRAKSLERLDLPVPIPAIDFYDDAMPKRYAMAHRYGR